MRQRVFVSLWIGFVTLAAFSVWGASSTNLLIRQFQPEKPISRALRPSPVSAVIVNRETNQLVGTVSLVLPAGVRLLQGQVRQELALQPGAEQQVSWDVEADEAGHASLGLEVRCGGELAARGSLVMPFLNAMPQRRLNYIPDPVPAPTQILIGAHHCPLWEPDQPDLWQNVLRHPERTPALGFYSQNQPEVADWETKWATEHGISFFVYCWYRTSQGGAVKTKFSSAIHDALFRSKFVNRMRFTIMWENQARGIAGVADEHDLLNNLVPYWITNYFRHSSYLKVDNRPVLFIYRPEFLVQDLGGVTNVARAFQQMREACRRAGFEGLYLLGEYRGTDPKHLSLMKSLGLDYTFAYCWHVPDNPTPERAIETQMGYIRKTSELNILPQVVTVSQAWSGWRDEGSIWKIPPASFEELLRQAGQFIATLPPDQLGRRMLLLDNWNEWGEGHYIAPYREYGFGYLDAVRNVFSSAPRPHVDLIPEDIGLGPYDREIRAHLARQEELRRLASRRMVVPSVPNGAVGWWTFDEETDTPVAWDYSGHQLGGALERARRVPGFSGQALLCDGGAVMVAHSEALTEFSLLSVECRVKTELPGQNDKWILNRIFGSDPACGFRLGLVGGRPSFHLPKTNWSHNLTSAIPLPTNRWVHLAATFDGERMRLYLDGEECGTLARPGPLRPCHAPLVLGNYDVGHSAHFTGLLDDVRLYQRVLSPEEIRRNAEQKP